jgi:hypothetical protein
VQAGSLYLLSQCSVLTISTGMRIRRLSLLAKLTIRICLEILVLITQSQLCMRLVTLMETLSISPRFLSCILSLTLALLIARSAYLPLRNKACLRMLTLAQRLSLLTMHSLSLLHSARLLCNATVFPQSTVLCLAKNLTQMVKSSGLSHQKTILNRGSGRALIKTNMLCL